MTKIGSVSAARFPRKLKASMAAIAGLNSFTAEKSQDFTSSRSSSLPVVFQTMNTEPSWLVGTSCFQDAELPSNTSSVPSACRSTISMTSEPSQENKQGIASLAISDYLTDRCDVP